MNLLYHYVRLNLLRLLQQIAIFPLYFKYPLFKTDLLFLKYYAYKNPYRICKKYFQKQNQKVDYGDTWPLTIYKLAQVLQLSKEDVVYELGAGTARSSFWFHQISGCKVVAIELVPTFVEIAKKIQRQTQARVVFLQKDFLTVNYSEASVIYFYSSSFSEKTLKKIVDHWRALLPKTKIITTSICLKDYDKDGYDLLGEYRVSYPWGVCSVFVHEKT